MSNATGLRPAGHGVFDLWEFDTSSSKPTAKLVTRRKGGKAIWNVLSEYGKHVVVVNVPLTYPPEKEPFDGRIAREIFTEDTTRDVEAGDTMVARKLKLLQVSKEKKRKKLNNQRLRSTLIITLLLLSIASGAWAYLWLDRLYDAKVPFGPEKCGITRTGTGYTFSWLHVENADIASDTHCIVDLKGFNLMAIEFANGVGGFDTPVTEQLVAWFNKTFRMNVWRVPLNGYWWNTNAYVPQAHMYYRNWIQQIVKWFEQYGDYVILTFTSYFPNPPCVYGGQCSSQDQALHNLQTDLYDALVQAQQDAFKGATEMWANVAALYSNDPAVFYDGLNETCCISAQTWQDRENMIIKIIRMHNPRALIFLGGPDFNGEINSIIQGSVPNFSQPNLVYDFHVYDGYNNGSTCQEPNSYIWQDWPVHANEQVRFAQQHNDAVAFNEWGGCVDVHEYNLKLTTFARLHHICLVYYVKDNVVTMVGGAYQLTSNGVEVQQAYASS